MSTRPHVRFATPDGSEITLAPGELVGRMAGAALRIEDPRISEAHAMVSLRGAELKLLALRGRLSVDGRPESAVRLVPGARVVLAGFYALTVRAAVLPDEVIMLELADGDGEIHGPLSIDGVVSLYADPLPRLVPRFEPDAPAIVWSSEDGLRVRVGATPDRLYRAGETLTLLGYAARVVQVPLSTLASHATLDQGGFDVALTLVLHYDTVHVRPSVGPPVVFDGLMARLLTEVAQLETPVSWLSLARLLWEDEDDEHILRYRWDQATSRIRKKLRAGRVRADLLRSTGGGLVELFLGPGDRIEDLA